MTKPMTHLEAFCSDDAKRGRVWTTGTEDFRRWNDTLQGRDANAAEYHPWVSTHIQVAAMTGVVHWADEPKTLTPQEANTISKADLNAAADILDFVVDCDGDTRGWKIRVDIEGIHHKYLDAEAMISISRLAARLRAAGAK